jgi:putative heme iron utilization protein
MTAGIVIARSEATKQSQSRQRRKGSAMSERPDIRLTPDEQAAFLRKNRKCALATIDQDGFPHLVAMNFAVRDGTYYMTSYGKAQKVRNIRRNPIKVYTELNWALDYCSSTFG